jgi:hypothetical protein
MSRPAKLRYSATHVPRAVKLELLPSGLKLVWMELHGLDNSPEGATMGASSLAARLGTKPDSVEKARRELVGLGLLVKLEAAPGVKAGWRCVLPDDCVPQSQKPGWQEVQALARRLEAHLTARLRTPVPQSGGPEHPTRIPVRGTPVPQSGGFAETPPHDSPPVLAQNRENTPGPQPGGMDPRMEKDGKLPSFEDGERSHAPQRPKEQARPEEQQASPDDGVDAFTHDLQRRLEQKRRAARGES